mgnify:FL=1
MVDNTVLKIEQIDLTVKVSSENIKEQLISLKESQKNISEQIEKLNSELIDVEKLEFEIINNLKNESISKIIK